MGNPPGPSQQFLEGLFDVGGRDLFYTLRQRSDGVLDQSVLNISILQHMAIHRLQYDLSCYAKHMYQTSQFCSELPGEAVQRLDYMTQCALRGYADDPFLVSSSKALECRTLETAGLLPDHVFPAGPLAMPVDHEHPRLRQKGRNQAVRAARKEKTVLRFSMATAGGVFLLVPMIIMATVSGLIASLVTTCVSVLVFAGLIAWRTDLTPNEVLGTTAAYTAVLVVFVGTSLTPKAGS